MRALWLRRLAVLVAGNVGLLAFVAHADYVSQQHCEPVVRR